MRTTMNVAFYCRNSKKGKDGRASVELSIILNGERRFINLPFKEDPNVFNKKRKSVELENRLGLWRNKVNTVIDELLEEGVALTTDTIREALRTGGVKSYTVNNMFMDFMKVIKTRGITNGSLRKYELTKELFISFLGGDKQLNLINTNHIIDFYLYLNNKYQTNSSASYMAKLKSVFAYAVDNGKLRKMPFAGIQIKRERKQIEYLTNGEIEKIKTTKMSTDALERIKDIFLVQMFSGLSFIDLENLKHTDIKQKGDIYYICKERQKTKVKYTAVLIEDAIDILKKYDYKLPIISNQKTNSGLKAIARECGINKNVYTHLARKTYGHILLERGVRIEAVAKALGHTEIKTTQRYYAELQTDTILNEISNGLKSH